MTGIVAVDTHSYEGLSEGLGEALSREGPPDLEEGS